MGWIASSVSVDAAIALGGVGTLLAGLGVLVWLRRIQARRGVPLMAAAASPTRKHTPTPVMGAPSGAAPGATTGAGTP
jgi:hypothetical protein